LKSQGDKGSFLILLSKYPNKRKSFSTKYGGLGKTKMLFVITAICRLKRSNRKNRSGLSTPSLREISCSKYKGNSIKLRLRLHYLAIPYSNEKIKFLIEKIFTNSAKKWYTRYWG